MARKFAFDGRHYFIGERQVERAEFVREFCRDYGMEPTQ